MYQEKGFKTIFDDVKANRIYGATIKEDEVIKPKKSFSVNNDDLDFGFIVDEYKMPSFKLVSDNLVINDFYDYPDVIMSQNPEYRYKYPKLSTEEAMRQYAQTEEGVPNELNRFLRQDETGQSLEDIKNNDNAYTEGLVNLQKIIDDDYNKNYKYIKEARDQLKNNTSLSTLQKSIRTIKIEEAKENLDKNKENSKFIEKYKKTNRVLIKPVVALKPVEVREKILEKAKKESGTDDLTDAQLKAITNEQAKKIQDAFKERKVRKTEALSKVLTDKQATTLQTLFRGKQAKKELASKMVTRSQAKKTPLKPQPPPPPIITPPIRSPKVSAPNTFKPKILAPVTPQKEVVKEQLLNTPEEINKLTKIQSKVRGNIAKKLVEEKRKLIDNSDEKTVVQDTTPPIESFKLNQNAYNLILAKYKDRPNTDSIDSFEKEDVVKIKGLMKNLSINLNTKRLDKLRNKFKT